MPSAAPVLISIPHLVPRFMGSSPDSSSSTSAAGIRSGNQQECCRAGRHAGTRYEKCRPTRYSATSVATWTATTTSTRRPKGAGVSGSVPLWSPVAGRMRKYRIVPPAMRRIFSTDHKAIGLQYACTSGVFLCAGFLLIGATRRMMERPLPPAAAAYAADVDRVIWLVHLLMLALAAGWAAYFLWALVRFRRNRHPRADAVGASGRLALGVACSQLCGLAHFACAVS